MEVNLANFRIRESVATSCDDEKTNFELKDEKQNGSLYENDLFQMIQRLFSIQKFNGRFQILLRESVKFSNYFASKVDPSLQF